MEVFRAAPTALLPSSILLKTRRLRTVEPTEDAAAAKTRYIFLHRLPNLPIKKVTAVETGNPLKASLTSKRARLPIPRDANVAMRVGVFLAQITPAIPPWLLA